MLLNKFVKTGDNGAKEDIEKSIRIEEERQNGLFLSLGHLYYEQVINGIIKADESLSDLLNEIEDSDKRIKQYRDEIVKNSKVIMCPKCHSRCSADSIFCTNCGTSLGQEEILTKKQCVHCGTLLGEDDLFCFHCGIKVE